MLRSVNNEMRRFGPRPPAARGCCDQARYDASTQSPSRFLDFARDWEGDVSHVSIARCRTSSKDVPGTVVLMRAKSGSESLNARISDGRTKKVKSLGKSVY